MMQVIGCKNCGKSEIGLENTSVNVKFTKFVQICDVCEHRNEESESDFFCSKECFENYYPNFNPLKIKFKETPEQVELMNLVSNGNKEALEAFNETFSNAVVKFILDDKVLKDIECPFLNKDYIDIPIKIETTARIWKEIKEENKKD